MKRLLTLAISLGLFVVLAVPVSAGSVPPGTQPPPLSCFPGIGFACQETDHFSAMTFFGSPLPCPGPVGSGWVLIDATGNGVQHMNVNAAQDFWFTTTLAGPATIQPINITSPIPNPVPQNWVPPSWTPNGPPFFGQLQQWFGVQGNRSNFSSSFTINFSGATAAGQSLAFHFNTHMNSTGASPFTLNPHSFQFHC
jgi:hypothetical protein